MSSCGVPHDTDNAVIASNTDAVGAGTLTQSSILGEHASIPIILLIPRRFFQMKQEV